MTVSGLDWELSQPVEQLSSFYLNRVTLIIIIMIIYYLYSTKLIKIYDLMQFTIITINKTLVEIELTMVKYNTTSIVLITVYIIINYTGLPLRAVTRNTCYSWVYLIFPWCYGWNCLLLIEFNHKVTSLQWVWRTRLLVSQNSMTALLQINKNRWMFNIKNDID